MKPIHRGLNSSLWARPKGPGPSGSAQRAQPFGPGPKGQALWALLKKGRAVWARPKGPGHLGPAQRASPLGPAQRAQPFGALRERQQEKRSCQGLPSIYRARDQARNQYVPTHAQGFLPFIGFLPYSAWGFLQLIGQKCDLPGCVPRARSEQLGHSGRPGACRHRAGRLPAPFRGPHPLSSRSALGA